MCNRYPKSRKLEQNFKEAKKYMEGKKRIGTLYSWRLSKGIAKISLSANAELPARFGQFLLATKNPKKPQQNTKHDI